MRFERYDGGGGSFCLQKIKQKFKVDFSTAQRQMIIPATMIVVQVKLAQIRF